MSEIVAIASGKGGVGKTWLTASLGHALARLRRRVLVFDGDLGLANLDIQLGLDPAFDLGAVIAGRCRLADAVHHHAETGFDLIPGRSGSGRLGALEPARLDALLADLRALARRYDLVLLDLPAGVDLVVRELLATADLGLVVTTDEPTALTDAYALIKVGHWRPAPGRYAIVVNLAPSLQAGEQTHAGLRRVCERFLQLSPQLAGVIRRDPRVPDAIRHQSPFLLRHPLAAAAKDVETLARRLAAGR